MLQRHERPLRQGVQASTGCLQLAWQGLTTTQEMREHRPDGRQHARQVLHRCRFQVCQSHDTCLLAHPDCKDPCSSALTSKKKQAVNPGLFCALMPAAKIGMPAAYAGMQLHSRLSKRRVTCTPRH